MLETDVLVVGGSLVGLSASVFLAHHGVRCQTVERHAATSIHPRARGFTARSMELYRSVGLAEDIEETGTVDESLGVMMTSPGSLSDGDWVTWHTTAEASATGVSPYQRYACDQDRLEPLLLKRARRLGASISCGAELTDVVEDGDGLTATVLDRHRDTIRQVRARYLLAADGAASGMRRRLGIGMHGPGSFGHKMNILFTADLDPAVRGRRFFACEVGSVASGMIVRRDQNRWQMSVDYHPDRGESTADFTQARCRALVEKATGLPGLTMQVLGVMPWEVIVQVADRYREGRIFLVGDAAHTTTPWGGLGGNTGIQDAHNIAWKLAAVVSGRAGPALLDSYELERQPVAELTIRHALAKMHGKSISTDDATISLGYRYRAGALLPEDDGDEQLVEDPRYPSGRPGTRAPHIELNHLNGRAASLLDWFGRDWVLLTGPAGGDWATAAGSLDSSDLSVHQIGADDRAGDLPARWSAAYGVDAAGAVLVRPDGFIAWRAPRMVPNPAGTLRAVLAELSGLARTAA